MGSSSGPSEVELHGGEQGHLGRTSNGAPNCHLQKDVRPPVASKGVPTTTVSSQKCVNGRAGACPCSGIDLLSFVPLDDFRGSEAFAPLGGRTSDIWGWVDPESGDEYVLLGKTNGTACFRVTDPTQPVYLGALLNSSPAQLIWHDIKVYKDHAFIVSGVASHIHDAQCVLYRGPDHNFGGREICFNSSETHMSVVDVTDDHATFPMADELDEDETVDKTRTLIFDVSKLTMPRFVSAHDSSSTAIDHNMYIKDGLVYQSNYAAGLRMLDSSRAAQGRLSEVAFFDSFPEHDEREFVGTWSNYPYFPSGTIAFSGIDDGLFLVKAQPQVLARHATG